MLTVLHAGPDLPVQESAYIAEGTTLDFDAILPKDRSYVTYEGSLTTPPCTGDTVQSNSILVAGRAILASDIQLWCQRLQHMTQHALHAVAYENPASAQSKACPHVFAFGCVPAANEWQITAGQA